MRNSCAYVSSPSPPHLPPSPPISPPSHPPSPGPPSLPLPPPSHPSPHEHDSCMTHGAVAREAFHFFTAHKPSSHRQIGGGVVRDSPRSPSRSSWRWRLQVCVFLVGRKTTPSNHFFRYLLSPAAGMLLLRKVAQKPRLLLKNTNQKPEEG